jgi:hypothetical protein
MFETRFWDHQGRKATEIRDSLCHLRGVEHVEMPSLYRWKMQRGEFKSAKELKTYHLAMVGLTEDNHSNLGGLMTGGSYSHIQFE